jgi:dihydroorotase
VFGIDRPRVAVGAKANLTLIDLGREWTVDVFKSKSRNSWLLGQTLTGAVAMTIANGAVAFEA